MKSAASASAGTALNAQAIAARQAGAGSFVEAELHVYGDPRTLYGRGGRGSTMERSGMGCSS